MSERFRLVLLLIVLLYLFVAIKLIHRKRLSLNYSLLWLLMAVVLVVMVVFPNLVYNLTWLLGIDLPIHMIFTGFSFFALLMLFYLTCIVSRDNEKNRTMVQQMARWNPPGQARKPPLPLRRSQPEAFPWQGKAFGCSAMAHGRAAKGAGPLKPHFATSP